MERLRKRAEFLAAAKGRRTGRRAFVMETRSRGDGGPARFGFTVTKRLARKAVERNRIRRRLKAAARLASVEAAGRDADFVIVGRHGALAQTFSELVADIAGAIRQSGSDETRKQGPMSRSSIR